MYRNPWVANYKYESANRERSDRWLQNANTLQLLFDNDFFGCLCMFAGLSESRLHSPRVMDAVRTSARPEKWYCQHVNVAFIPEGGKGDVHCSADGLRGVPQERDGDCCVHWQLLLSCLSWLLVEKFSVLQVSCKVPQQNSHEDCIRGSLAVSNLGRSHVSTL